MEEVEQRKLKAAHGVAAMGLPRVAVEELAHAALVFFGVVDVAHGVCRVGRNPQGFDARFGNNLWLAKRPWQKGNIAK